MATTALVGAVPASASREQCATASHGHRVVAESGRGLVYAKGDRLLGCSYAGGRISVLPGQGKMKQDVDGETRSGTARIESIQIAGRFVAYGSHWIIGKGSGGHLGPAQTERVISFDLRAGRIKYATTPNDDRTVRLDVLVLKRNGSVAWMYDRIRFVFTSEMPDTVVVKMDRQTGGDERGLDTNAYDKHGDPQYTIEPGSLALSANGTRIYWTAHIQGEAQEHHLAAPLL